MNPLYTQFKRKFSLSMYKNMSIFLGEMNFLKDFVNDTRGDLYPIVAKSADCSERVGGNRYYVDGGSVERVFCQFFPFATYEMRLDELSGEAGFVFRLRGDGGDFAQIGYAPFSFAFYILPKKQKEVNLDTQNMKFS